jgi:hypothetical protein
VTHPVFLYWETEVPKVTCRFSANPVRIPATFCRNRKSHAEINTHSQGTSWVPCYPSYSRGGDCGSRSGKKVPETPIWTSGWAPLPSYMGSINRSISVHAGPDIKRNPMAKITKCLASMRLWVWPPQVLPKDKKDSQVTPSSQNNLKKNPSKIKLEDSPFLTSKHATKTH